MTKHKPSELDTVGIWTLVIILLSQLYAQLDTDLISLLLFSLIPVFLSIHSPNGSYPFKFRFWKDPELSLGAIVSSHLLFTVFISSPIFLFVFSTWNSEFSFGGDRLTHISQQFRTGLFWATELGSPSPPNLSSAQALLFQIFSTPEKLLFSRFFVIFVLIVITILAMQRWNLKILAFSLFVVVACLSFIDFSQNFRWPSLAYFLSLPVTSLLLVLDHESLWAGLQITNACAVPIWLFLLRPVILGKLVTIWMLPFCIGLFWNPVFVSLACSTYLEPWAIVLSLLALEGVIRNGRVFLAPALILTSLAALTKEPAILLLPVVIVLALVPKKNVVDSCLPSPSVPPTRGIIPILGLSIIPFALYTRVRSELGTLSGINPQIELRSWRPSLDQLFDGGLSELFRTNILSTFGLTGLCVLVAVSLILVWEQRTRPFRIYTGILIIGALGYVLFFALDGSAANFTGYPRFIIWSVTVALAPLLLLDTTNARHQLRAKVTLLFLFLIAALNQASLLSRDPILIGENIWRSNISFYRDDPIYLPIRSLVKHDTGLHNEGTKIYSNRPDFYVTTNIFGFPESLIEFEPGPQVRCECDETHQRVLFLTVHISDRQEAIHKKWLADSARAKKWSNLSKLAPECASKIKTTCAQSVFQFEEDQIIGAYGFPHH